MGDDIAEMLGGFIFLALILGIVAAVAMFVGMVILPIGLTGAGVLYYVHNIHLPQKRHREARARTEHLVSARARPVAVYNRA